MTIDHRIKLELVCWTLMVVLAAAGLATSALAADAASQPPSDAKTTNSGTQSPDSSTGGENKTPSSGAADGGVNTEDIDTRITVQPHAPPGKSGKLGGTTNPIQPLKLINPHRRTFSSRSRVAPGASGMQNGQREILQHGPAEHFESKGVGLVPGAGIATGVGNANIGLAKPGVMSREPIFHSPTISPLGTAGKNHTRFSVGGPTSNHRAVGVSTVGIGGPAHAVNGINGTTIRESR
jgi:hypothetical protein